MAIRLHEIELGVKDLNKSVNFYREVLGIELTIDQPQLKVFNSNTSSVDFNLSTHYARTVTCISFLTDNLHQIIDRLKLMKVEFEGPQTSHLGMRTVIFEDPDGNTVKVNTPTDNSPEWLKV